MKRILTSAIVLATLTVASLPAFANNGEIISQETTVTSVNQTDYMLNNRKMPRAQVVQLQRALATKGHYRGNFDGIFGIGTKTAVEQYQGSMGVTQNGALTLAELEDLGIYMSGTDATAINSQNYGNVGPTAYGTKTVTEYETRTIVKGDIVKYGNGPHARGRQAFLD